MGALTRMKAWMNSWMRAKVNSYPGFVNYFAEEFYKVAPGLTVGGTTLIPLSSPSAYTPNSSGEKEGELYLSDDQNPHLLWIWTSDGWLGLTGAASGSTVGAPLAARYILQQPDASLFNAQALNALGTGLVKNTTGTGVLSISTSIADLPDRCSGPGSSNKRFRSWLRTI